MRLKGVVGLAVLGSVVSFRILNTFVFSAFVAALGSVYCWTAGPEDQVSPSSNVCLVGWGLQSAGARLNFWHPSGLAPSALVVLEANFECRSVGVVLFGGRLLSSPKPCFGVDNGVGAGVSVQVAGIGFLDR